MLTRWLSNLETVHFAKTREERDAIYRFRYTVYVEELGRKLGNPDHERRMVFDADDERDVSTHLYTGTPDNVTGSLRVRCWEPGEVSDYEFKQYNMGIFPGIKTTRTAELGRLMIRPTMRGSLLLLAITRSAYELMARDFKADLAFCYGAPGLVRHYRKLGFTLFPCPLIPTPDGMNVGLVSVLSDYEHHRRVDSPVRSLTRKYYPRDKRNRDRELYGRILQDAGGIPLETDPRLIWEEVESGLIHGVNAVPSFLESLPPRVVEQLSSKGFIVDLKANTMVTKKGHGEREMFVILDGTCEVLDDADDRIALLAKGDIFGEVAFFRESGRRSASVRAVEDGKVLMLRRRFLDELMEKDPSAASQILFNLGRILSERLATMITERHVTDTELDFFLDEDD